MNRPTDERGNRKITNGDWLLLAVSLLFYLLFPVLDGPVWCADSQSYVSMHITREPLYPTFLALCRAVCAVLDMDPLMMAAVLQSLLAGAATWYAGYVIKKTKNDSGLLQLAAVVSQFAVTLICRFVAIRGSAYTESIMTEGLGLSLFVLFSLKLYQYLISGKKRCLLETLFFSFLLISLRKQMTITLLIMGIVFLWRYLLCDRKIKKVCCLFGLLVGVLLAGKLADRTYNYVVRGAWIEHSGNSMGILCTLLYTSDAEHDQKLFGDETVKELYLSIMQQAKEQQLLYADADKGWLALTSHYADSYDEIGYHIINPVVEEYLTSHGELSEVEKAREYDAICRKMSRTLFRQKPVPLLRLYTYNTWKGMVNSIARANPVLSLYALAAYLLMGAISVFLAVQRRKLKCMERQEGGVAPYREMARQIEHTMTFVLIVMTGIVINSMVVGLLIFTQPRYMLYGMGLFYTAGCMLLYDVVHCHRMLREEML